MNLLLFLFSIVHFVWLFIYKLFLIKIECGYEFMPVLGEVYFSISLSIVAGYIIYVITTEYPHVRQLIKYSFAYFEFIARMNFILFKLCTNFNIEKHEYKKSQLTNVDLENKVSKLIGDGTYSLDDLKEKLIEFSDEIKKKLIECESFKYYPDHFYSTNLNFKFIESILLLQKPDTISILSLRTCVTGDCVKLFNFLNTTVVHGVRCLSRLGCDKKTLEAFEL